MQTMRSRGYAAGIVILAVALVGHVWMLGGADRMHAAPPPAAVSAVDAGVQPSQVPSDPCSSGMMRTCTATLPDDPDRPVAVPAFASPGWPVHRVQAAAPQPVTITHPSSPVHAPVVLLL